MNVHVLASSSKGNCYIIEDSGHKLILDAGVNIKDIKNHLGFDFSSVAGCLVTHEHLDHHKSSMDLAKAGVQVYMSKGTMKDESHHNWNVVKFPVQFKVGSFTVLPFDIQHDAAEPLGFLIYTPSGKTVLYATDTYYLKYRFEHVDKYIIECNHDKASLLYNVDHGYLPKALLKRLTTSHFSFENLMEYFKKADLSTCEDILLIHLSDKNSNAEYYKRTMQAAFGIPVTIGEKGIVI